MSILKIARMGHPVLRARARPLDRAEIKSSKIQKLVDDMIETMREYHGIGLAAPQIHEGLRIFVAGLEEAEEVPGGAGELEVSVLINPELTPVSPEIIDDWEGCLSIPDIRGRVPRFREIQVRALGRDAAAIQMTARDLPARVIQHETDHLDGLLFLDRMESFASLTYLEEYSRHWEKS